MSESTDDNDPFSFLAEDFALPCAGLRDLHWRNLDITADCEVSSKFFSMTISNRLEAQFEGNVNGTSHIKNTIDFLKATARNQTFMNDPNCIENDLHIYLWSFQMNNAHPTGFKEGLQLTAKNCTETFCKKIEWPGNADIVGKGMIAAFAIEAIIVSAFALAAVLACFQTLWFKGWKIQAPLSENMDSTSPEVLGKEKRRRRSSNAFEKIPKSNDGKTPFGTRFRSAFRGTIAGFWEGSVMFAMSLAIASSVAFFKKAGSYSLFFSALVTVFSSSCVFVLWPLVDGITSRRHLYNFMLFLITMQQVVLFGAFEAYKHMDEYYKDYQASSKEDGGVRGELWEQHCFYLIEPIAFIEKIVSITLGFGCIVFVKMFLLDFVRPLLFHRNRALERDGKKQHRAWLLTRTYGENTKIWMDLLWKVFVGGCGFGMMWGSYARIIIGKQRLLKIGPESEKQLDGENTWEFGQITALLVWAPYSLEFIFILCFGYRKAITSRIPKDLKAMWARDSPDDQSDPANLGRRDTMVMSQPFTVSKDELSYGDTNTKGNPRISVTIPSHSEKIADEIEIVESPSNYEPIRYKGGGNGDGV